jgi:NADH-quinone oxidoreductase subunit L
MCKVSTLKAAFKAYSFNKASDLFLFFAILLVFNLTYTLDIPTFISYVHVYENFVINFIIEINYLELISLFLVGAAFIKSAQFGAHIWLPDSMEAPVPASALIHSATLVSAGIYLLLRFSALFELSQLTMGLIAVVGSLTAFYGGVVSMYQSDIKRILAYSTISHCGFLMVLYTTGIMEYVVLYLYVHGFFKATVFLSVGNIIRFCKNNQDFKRMGLFYKYLPFDCFASFICLINLSGLPFTFGFYIKHLLFIGLNSNFILYYFVLINCLLGALTGLFYSYRLFYYVFFDIKKAKKKQYFSAISNILNSKFYSNTTISASLSIMCLIFVSYIISLTLLYIYMSKEYNFSGFNNFISYISFIDNFNSSLTFLTNVSYIN